MNFASADATDKTPLAVWGINGNMGQEYLMTSDGLMVATLFKDQRQSKPWPDKAVRDMPLNDVSLNGESFFNTISQTNDGKVYVQSANHIIRVDGLDSLRRSARADDSGHAATIETGAGLFRAKRRRASGDAKGGGTLTGRSSMQPRRSVDGKLDDWR